MYNLVGDIQVIIDAKHDYDGIHKFVRVRQFTEKQIKGGYVRRWKTVDTFLYDSQRIAEWLAKAS